MKANRSTPANRELRPLWHSAINGATRLQRIESRTFVCDQILSQISVPVEKSAQKKEPELTQVG